MKPRSISFAAEEIANAAVQGAGTLLSIAGLIVLLRAALNQGDPVCIASVAIYGATLVVAFFSSAAYHASYLHLPFGNPAVRRGLRALDHCAIYLLIAGTYTPIALVSLRDYHGLALAATVWLLALLGILLRLLGPPALLKARVVLYVALGWVVLAWGNALSSVLRPEGTTLLLAGGAVYTTGVLFYLWPKLPFRKAIWHSFVIAGSACFFVAILRYGIPAA